MKLTGPQLIVGAAVVGIVVLALVFWPRTEVSDEEQIRRDVVAMTTAAETRSLGDLMEQVSERFSSGEGWSKQDVKAVLLGQVLRGTWVRIFVTEISVTMRSSSTADCTAKFVFSRTRAKTLQELARDSVVSSVRIDAKFAKESDGKWRVVSAHHEQVDPTSLF